MDTEVRVREAMTTNVVTVTPETSVNEVAKKMSQKNIGCVIVVKSKKPVGIVTERDICYRVVAENKQPGKVPISKIMSSPIITVEPGKTITEAAKSMVKNNIRRLPVIENGKLIGIITNKDIVAISPETIEILKEISKMREEAPAGSKEVPERGICEVCGDYVAVLYEVDGKFVCEDCREDMMGGE